MKFEPAAKEQRMKFRKKPVVVEAIQWTGSNGDEIARFCGGKCTFKHGNPEFFTLESHSAPLEASPGDWIIKGIVGEFYPCKPDIFEQTYEPVDDGGPRPH
jgi:hypothetical protein